MGNRTSYILPGTIGLVLSSLLAWMILFPRPSGPVLTAQAGVLDMAPFEYDPADLTGRQASGQDDAGAFLAQAVQAAKTARGQLTSAIQNGSKIRQGQAHMSPDERQAAAAVAGMVSQAAAQRNMNYLWQHTPQSVQIGGMQRRTSDDLQAVLDALYVHRTALIGQQDFAAAEQSLFDQLTVGHLLSQEHKRVWIDLIGVSFQRNACDQLVELYEKYWPEQKAKAAAVRKYLAGLERVQRHYDAKIRILKDLRNLTQYPGDVYNIAENDANPAWRREAVAALGVIKFTATSRGDRKHVDKLLRQYSQSGDPIEAAAAKAARDLTPEQYQALGETVVPD